MLYFETIDAQTYELLKQLQAQPAFKKLRLVGRTALALQFGHRKSIDIDLFGKIDADEFEVLNQVKSVSSPTILKRTKNINVFLLNGIKVDIVNFPYPWLYPAVEQNSLILAKTPDIAAMKLSAITGRGTRKDFIDLFFLLKQFSLRQMLDFYKQKYADGTEFLVIKSLTYFKDAEQDEFPIMLIQQNWEEIKHKIAHEVNKYMQQ